MYVPPSFRKDDVSVLLAAIQRAGLATLVTTGAAGPEASHVPVLLDPSPAPYGTLTGHLAAANPQWRSAGTDSPALMIFLGPDAYISPAWYASKRATGKVVPTWNYIAIHASGPVRFFRDRARLREHVTKLTARQEAGRPDPWSVSDAPADFIDGMLEAIVGFELLITRLEGKWKLGQNRPEADRAGAVQGLDREGGPTARSLAAIMAGEAEPWLA